MIAAHVAQLLQAPVGTSRTYDFAEEEPELQNELGLQGPIRGTMKLTRTSHGILADCQYQVDLDQECGRCLGVARAHIDSEFSQEFLPTTNVLTGLPQTLAADPDEPRINPEHVLDITDQIRQDIVLQQPLQPLCRPECAGLCPTCGEDLNMTRCGHESTEQEDGGLSRLGELLATKLKAQGS